MNNDILAIVKSKPTFFIELPIFDFIFNKTCHAIYPYIYVPKRVYINLHSKAPETAFVGIIYHEYTHIVREKSQGFWKWIFHYMTNSKFRYEEEIIADKSQMEYLKINNAIFDIEKRAKFLSGWTYLKPVSYQKAKEDLTKMWHTV